MFTPAWGNDQKYPKGVGNPSTNHLILRNPSLCDKPKLWRRQGGWGFLIKCRKSNTNLYPVPWGMKFCSTSPNTGRFSWEERDVFDDALVLLLPIFIRWISCCFVPFLDHKKRSHKQHCHIWKEIAFGIHVKFPWVYSMNFLFDIRFLPWQTRYQALWTGKSNHVK